MSRVFTTSELEGVLSDYTIRLTGYDPTTGDRSETTTNTISNPPNWPTDHHRIPNYRPIDRNRDAESRPNARGFERVFLTIMFSGVAMNAVSKHYFKERNAQLIFMKTAAKIWGATGGPYFPNLFKYAIGGEW